MRKAQKKRYDEIRNAALEESLQIVIAERKSDFPDLRTVRDAIRVLKTN